LKLVNIQQPLKKPKRGRKPKGIPALQKDQQLGAELNSDSDDLVLKNLVEQYILDQFQNL